MKDTIYAITKETNKLIEALKIKVKRDCQTIANALPEGVTGFRFDVDVEETRDSQSNGYVVNNVEFRCNGTWVAVHTEEFNAQEACGDLTQVHEFVEYKGDILYEGTYEWNKGDSLEWIV